MLVVDFPEQPTVGGEEGGKENSEVRYGLAGKVRSVGQFRAQRLTCR